MVYFLAVVVIEDVHRGKQLIGISQSALASHSTPQPCGWARVVAVFAKSESSRVVSRGLQQFAHTPDVIRNPSGDGRGHADGFVHAAEVIEGEPARDRSPVFLPLLAEGVRQAREAPRAHPDGQILPFHDTGADALRVGLTENWGPLPRIELRQASTALRRPEKHDRP